MKNAIILHGKPGRQEYYDPDGRSQSNSHWLPWLQQQLVVRDIAAHTPEVPNAWRPHYPTWQREFERYEITPESFLVGHSRGGAFLVRWLSEHQGVTVGRVALVAPATILGPEDEPDFFDCDVDPQLARRTGGIVIFNSDNDAEKVQKSTRQLRDTLVGNTFREFHNYGHFTYGSMKTEQFPELLEALLS